MESRLDEIFDASKFLRDVLIDSKCDESFMSSVSLIFSISEDPDALLTSKVTTISTGSGFMLEIVVSTVVDS